MTLIKPSKGQPIDYSYISNMVQAINNLESRTSTKSAVSSTDAIGSPQSTMTQINTDNLVVWSGYRAFSNPSKETDNVTGSFDVTFDDVRFGQVPTVTVSVVANEKPETVSVGILEVTATKCKISVKFADKAVRSVRINIIAIGYATGQITG
jgi:hypothetical protein